MDDIQLFGIGWKLVSCGLAAYDSSRVDTLLLQIMMI